MKGILRLKCKGVLFFILIFSLRLWVYDLSTFFAFLETDKLIMQIVERLIDQENKLNTAKNFRVPKVTAFQSELFDTRFVLFLH